MDHTVGHNRPLIAVVMGVSGSGKSTIARPLAAELGWEYQEGDALHPPENVEKMKGGTPLTDADRLPWLKKIAEWIDDRLGQGRSGVVTCSALKRSYRDVIVGDRPDAVIVYLMGSPELIKDRLAERRGHFMPPALLDSQFAALEEPGADERAIVVDIAGTPEEIVREIIGQLRARRST